MNKRVLITILVILGLAIIAGGFWYAKNQQKENVVIKEKQEQNRQMNNEKENEMENMKKNQKQELKTERESIHTQPQLSPEEIEKLRKEKDLVWYTIPELGIKFLVTKDTKGDLRYKIKKGRDQYMKNGTLVFLYNQSESNYRKKYYGYDCAKKEDAGYCEKGFLLHIDVDAKKFIKKLGCDKVVFAKNHDVVCYTSPQAFNWTTEQYQKYLKTIKNKHFGIYLNTIQSIK